MEKTKTTIVRLTAILAIIASFVAMMFVLITSFSEESEDADRPREGVPSETQARGGEREQQPGEGRFYTVQEGDTLSSIAERTGVSVDELEELNPDIDPQILVAGARLRLR